MERAAGQGPGEQLSTVPTQRSLVRSASAAPSRWAALVAVTLGARRTPCSRMTGTADRAQVLPADPGAHGFARRPSQTIVDARWLAMPTPSTEPASARVALATSSAAEAIRAGSNSPGRGRACPAGAHAGARARWWRCRGRPQPGRRWCRRRRRGCSFRALGPRLRSATQAGRPLSGAGGSALRRSSRSRRTLATKPPIIPTQADSSATATIRTGWTSSPRANRSTTPTAWKARKATRAAMAPWARGMPACSGDALEEEPGQITAESRSERLLASSAIAAAIPAGTMNTRVTAVPMSTDRRSRRGQITANRPPRTGSADRACPGSGPRWGRAPP